MKRNLILIIFAFYDIFSMEIEVPTKIQQEGELSPISHINEKPLIKMVVDTATQEIKTTTIDSIDLTHDTDIISGLPFIDILNDRKSENLPVIIARIVTETDLVQRADYAEAYTFLRYLYKPIFRKTVEINLFIILENLKNRTNYPVRFFSKHPVKNVLLPDPVEFYFMWQDSSYLDFIGTDLQLFSINQLEKNEIRSFLIANAPESEFTNDEQRKQQLKAQIQLGELFEASKNYREAFKYFDLASINDLDKDLNLQAKYALARAYLEGLGTFENKEFPKRAGQLFKEVYDEAGDPKIKQAAELGLAYATIKNDIKDQNFEAALNKIEVLSKKEHGLPQTVIESLKKIAESGKEKKEKEQNK